MVAANLRDLMAAKGVHIRDQLYDEDDPLNIFRFAATLGPDICKQVEDALPAAETQASRSARPTPGADDFMRTCRRTGRPPALVSNNSHVAVEAHLAAHRLTLYAGSLPASIRTPL
jgi:beta-phosphoglucomutase-like phosphatase (HAD superfamily)